MGTGFGCEPVERGSPVPDVEVNIDKARRDVEAGNVHHFPSRPSGNIFFDRRDFAFGDCHVHGSVEVVRGIDNVAALKQQVITWRLRH